MEKKRSGEDEKKTETHEKIPDPVKEEQPSDVSVKRKWVDTWSEGDVKFSASYSFRIFQDALLICVQWTT